jgi:hypothetical protein
MMQVIGKRRTWDRIIYSGLYMQRYPSQTVWSLAISFHLMDYEDLGLCSVRQPDRDVYTVMKNQSHVSDSSDSANQGMAVGAKILNQCLKLET